MLYGYNLKINAISARYNSSSVPPTQPGIEDQYTDQPAPHPHWTTKN